MFARKVRVLIVFLIAFVFSVVVRAADDAGQQIDAIIAQPPAAALSAEQAAPIVKQLEALAASDPARKLEIDAYLIPYRRAMETASPDSPAPSATPQPSVAIKPKPLLFVKVPGAKAQVIRAVTATPQGAVIVVETPDGRKSIYQKDFVSIELSWFTDAELESGSLDLARLASRYESYEMVFPEGKSVLDAEAKKIRSLAAKARENDRQRSDEIQHRLQAVLALTYDTGHNYAREEIARILLDADSVRKTLPAHAAEIEQVVAPFRAHFENLLGGKTFVDGVWKTKDEAEAAARKRALDDKRASFAQSLSIPFDALVLSEARIFQAIKIPALAAVALVASGLILLCRRKHLMLAAMLILLPTASVVYIVFLLVSSGSAIDAMRTSGGADAAKISRLLFLTSLADHAVFGKGDERVSLTDQDVNEFLHAHLKFINDPGGKSAGVYATGVAVEIGPHGFILNEQVRYKSQFYRIRYDVQIDSLDKKPEVSCGSIKFGNALLPPPVKDWLWNNLISQLGKMQSEQPLLQNYNCARLMESELQLALKTEPPPAKVEQAPAPAATPVPGLTITPAASASPAAPAETPAPVEIQATPTPAPEPVASPSMQTPAAQPASENAEPPDTTN